MVVFVRTALGALLLLPFALRGGGLRVLRGHWPAVLGFAVLEIVLPGSAVERRAHAVQLDHRAARPRPCRSPRDPRPPGGRLRHPWRSCAGWACSSASATWHCCSDRARPAVTRGPSPRCSSPPSAMRRHRSSRPCAAGRPRHPALPARVRRHRARLRTRRARHGPPRVASGGCRPGPRRPRRTLHGAGVRAVLPADRRGRRRPVDPSRLPQPGRRRSAGALVLDEVITITVLAATALILIGSGGGLPARARRRRCGRRRRDGRRGQSHPHLTNDGPALRGRTGPYGPDGLGLDDHRDDHRPTPQTVGHPPTDDAPHDLLQHVRVGVPVARGLLQRRGELREGIRRRTRRPARPTRSA